MFCLKVSIVVLLSVGVLGQSNKFSSNNHVCSDCTNLVNSVFSFVSKKSVIDDVVNMLGSELCARSDSIQDCLVYVQDIVPQFLTFLKTQVPHASACRAFSLCHTTPTPTPTQAKYFITNTLKDFVSTHPVSAGPPPNPPTPPPATPECQYCQLAEGEIAMLLENQQAKAIVKQYLGEICAELPFNSESCANLLALYVDQVFHIMQGYLEDNEGCVELELCPKAATLLVE